ncbi:hypothetical protein SAMN05660649_05181 [Desulfotomaculum arcticum]|uniref:Uncharacterized protein n=1 Tax=Desulfotruncus arcticus DSM 17038 TaxID=1121424 RepID=A0A1I2ZZH9_9FIRM|nr:hypothetical protein [Desulfotruncus arcticus]SFH43267.1 hypothetical protein SAMN05660649_05181 [Desulfotomaculum arcticum] [Desulfotruncus arcticus DSM 17038]
MIDRFIEQFSQHKKEFLEELKKGNIKVNLNSDLASDSRKMALELFESWLLEKTTQERDALVDETPPFDEFLDQVLARAQKYLRERGIQMSYTSLSKQMGISETWKCIRVFGHSNIYYRIGKTRPRKGPNKGGEYLVMDLVMDGYKKKVFSPLLLKKEKIEHRLGVPLERELPKVEATGKYRLKLMLSDDVIKERNIRLAARKLADFVETTKPYLSELGVV